MGDDGMLADAAELRARLANDFDSAVDFTLVCDSRGAIIYANPAARAALRPNALDLDDCLGLESRTLVAEQAWPAARSGGTWEGTLEVETADGARPMALSITERAGCFILRGTDAERRALAAAFEGAPGALAIIDRAGSVERGNARWRELVGARSSLLEMVDPRERVELTALLARVTDQGLERAVIERRLIPPEGPARWIELALASVAATPGRVVASLTDVSERRLLEERVVSAQKMDALGRMAGGVAHDFNNVLTAIINLVSLAIDGTESPDARRDLEDALKAARSGAALTRHLLDFSRGQPAATEAIDLAALIRRMEPILRRSLPATVRLHLHLDLSVWVQGDSSRLEQVLTNVVLNARDAMPQGGSLEIGLLAVDSPAPIGAPAASSARTRWAWLEVRDDGVGMSEAVRARAFEPFFTTKAPGEGSGLGLATCFGIIRQHAGTISLESEPGVGTVIRVALPVTSPPPASERKPPPPRETAGSAASVLIVEDQPEVRRAVVRSLKRRGYRLLEASDAAEALEICRAERVQVVLSDVMMPGMPGTELAQRLAVEHPKIVVVLMSGFVDEARIDASIPDSVRFIAKPFEPSEIVSVIERAIVEQREKESDPPP